MQKSTVSLWTGPRASRSASALRRCPALMQPCSATILTRGISSLRWTMPFRTALSRSCVAGGAKTRQNCTQRAKRSEWSRSAFARCNLPPGCFPQVKQWNHIALVHDTSDKARDPTVALFVNGAQVRTLARSLARSLALTIVRNASRPRSAVSRCSVTRRPKAPRTGNSEDASTNERCKQSSATSACTMVASVLSKSRRVLCC